VNDLLALFKALSDRNRLRVVAALMKFDELCVCQILELLQISGATASRHLSLLVQAGLLTSRKEGRWIFYRLQRGTASHQPLLGWLAQAIEGSADLQDDRRRLAAIEACEPEIICRQQRTGKRKGF
jgi:ArsR family transcriptional regulator, arsenate/arsenite/antimonite-responsive transcriptional repressor